MLNKTETISSGNARVDMLGILGKDIEIKKSKNNNDYGVLTITVKRESGKVDWFTVFVWSQKLLNKLSADLKKGKCVWIVGELEVIKKISKATTEDQATFSSNIMTINVREENGISIQENIQIANDTDLKGLKPKPQDKVATDNIA